VSYAVHSSAPAYTCLVSSSGKQASFVLHAHYCSPLLDPLGMKSFDDNTGSADEELNDGGSNLSSQMTG